MGKVFPEAFIAGPLIGAEQADFVRNCLAHEGFERGGLNIRDYACHNITLAADRADDWSSAGTDAASSVAAAALILVPVFGQPTDEGFINFHNVGSGCHLASGAPPDKPCKPLRRETFSRTERQ
jgi:hypothetical protein